MTVNVCGALVSRPPLAVPPSSWAVTVTVLEPVWPDAGVKVRVPVAVDCRLRREQRVVVATDVEVDGLAGFVARTGRDVGGPPVDGVRAGVLDDRLVGSFGERRDIVDRAHGDGERRVPLVSVPPLAVPPSSCNVTDTVAVPNAFAAAV